MVRLKMLLEDKNKLPSGRKFSVYTQMYNYNFWLINDVWSCGEDF